MARTFSGVPGDSKCECTDHGCPVHKGQSDCRNLATTILYRVDMEDNTGTALCEDCADDAFDSGLFTNEIEYKGTLQKDADCFNFRRVAICSSAWDACISI